MHDKCFRPRDLWEIAKTHIDSSEPGLFICDDTVLAKTRSQKIELVNYQHSGNAHDVIAGIGLINLLWHGLGSESSIPICDMLSLAKSRGVNSTALVMDAWYSSLDNLKAIRSHGWSWVTTLRKNRLVNRDKRLENLDIPEEGLSVHLRGYGWIFFSSLRLKMAALITLRQTWKIQHLSKLNISRMRVDQLKSIIEQLNKLVGLNAVSFAPDERKEIISSSQLLLGLNNTSYG